jgi:hypothetical protein
MDLAPEYVRAAIANYEPTAQADPEVWHSFVDAMRKQVLQAVSAGHDQAAELATAVLEADAILTAWEACA